MEQELETLQQWVDESSSMVFFGGAGCSTESGIPDFRSVDGLYNQSYDQPPETILSASFFKANPEVFFRFHRDKLVCPEAKPNAAHLKLAELEQAGKLQAVITQNIDGLHQMAGSRNVLELHGTIHRAYCSKCGKAFPEEVLHTGTQVPRCDCGGVVRPDIVLYEEGLDEAVMDKSVAYLQSADLLIVGGTSLVVYPAAGLLRYYTGHRLVLINKDPTPYDARADLILHGPIGQILGQIQVRK
ncbi:MAG: NAD-dependent protein deacylase [Oscillospiraceae bacterium]|nr:NAD-dependent protein deacylase [Oscillospiraceae bacterium]